MDYSKRGGHWPRPFFYCADLVSAGEQYLRQPIEKDKTACPYAYAPANELYLGREQWFIFHLFYLFGKFGFFCHISLLLWGCVLRA